MGRMKGPARGEGTVVADAESADATGPSLGAVGVAIEIPEPWCTDLLERRVGYGDPRAHDIPTHVTLLPPTGLAPPEVPDVQEHLAAVADRHAPFTMVLRGAGTFQPVSQVVFVQVAQGVGQCEQLQADIRRGPVDRALEFPYHPHVTVAHDVDERILAQAFRDLAGYEAAFLVDSFRLFTHGGDGEWRAVAEYRLAGRD